MSDVHTFYLGVGVLLTVCLLGLVWGVTRIITKLLEAAVCMSQVELGQKQVEFQRKQHQDMVFLRREQMDRMSRSPFSGLGPRSRNDDPDQSH